MSSLGVSTHADIRSPWASSYQALRRNQNVLDEVSASLGNTEMKPNVHPFVQPPTTGQSAEEYINGAVGRSLSVGSMLLQSHRDTVFRFTASDDRLTKIEMKLLDHSHRLGKIESSCHEIIAGQRNAEAIRYNSRAYKNSSRLKPIVTKMFPDPESPATWEPHPLFPQTVIQFKKLRRSPDTVRDLLRYYEVSITNDGSSSEATDIIIDTTHQITVNMDHCLEELAFVFGLDLEKIGNLNLDI